jgi:site-specific DNA-methyltransferase (adenine-specific)
LNIISVLISNSSKEGQTVLDPFMGSGTTAVACVKEKRHFIGYELNKEYYDKACKRIDAEQRQLKLF